MASAVDGEMRGARRRLMETLREKGIHDLAVLRAFEMTPRHVFVPTGVRHRAYEDAPLPIGNGQTISQPYIHAWYLQLLKLKGTERVLEIGTGSGFQTVLLSHLVAQVFSIERVHALSQMARETIQKLGAKNISLLVGDGTIGWREYSPYDAILVSAAGPVIPEPLVSQLADGGRMVVPVGPADAQMLWLVSRDGDAITREEIAPVRFVPLVGRHGWEAG